MYTARTSFVSPGVNAVEGKPVAGLTAADPRAADWLRLGMIELSDDSAPTDGKDNPPPEDTTRITDPARITDPDALAGLTQSALRKQATLRGLPIRGSKADLIARIAEHDAA